MLKKTITYKDLDGNELTEDFYFHLSKATIAKMELSRSGGLTTYLREIVAKDDPQKIIDAFEDIIKRTIGRRSEDGKGFIQNDEIANAFMATEAYSNLFYELVTDGVKSAEFINGVMPDDIRKKMQEAPGELEQSEARLKKAIFGEEEKPQQPKKIGEYTEAQLLAMPKDEFDALMNRTNPQDMSKDHLVIAMHRKTSGK